MTVTQDEIAELEKYFDDCFSNDLPIDVKKVKRMQELKLERIKELADQHHAIMADRNHRLEIMQQHTREYLAKIAIVDLRSMPDIQENIFSELDKYDIMATHWVNEENTEWSESKALSIMAGILILINEVP
jgi:hypothetical protein